MPVIRTSKAKPSIMSGAKTEVFGTSSFIPYNYGTYVRLHWQVIKPRMEMEHQTVASGESLVC